jgi:hypothetical protein
VPDPSQPQSFNRYSYSYNNPLKYTDPTGHYVANANIANDCRITNACDFHGHIVDAHKTPETHWVQGAEDLWDEIMLEYYEGAFALVGDFVVDGVGLNIDGLEKAIDWAGNGLGPGEASFFDLLGKSADVIGSGFDALKYVARLTAIYEAYTVRGDSITLAQLDYLNTRAAAEVGASLGTMAAGALTGGSAAAAISAIEFGWNATAIAQGGDGPDEWGAKAYTELLFRAHLTVNQEGITYHRTMSGNMFVDLPVHTSNLMMFARAYQ